ncbi:universal stress protein UspA [Roseivivax halodurans JCM 10272]|uniref:Universal stress protein UspA n=1 Tax=Roseivivax halodurans JCM 10272 TaxID=1449350 RepID=X7EL70_9RHOB|nr:universal stress protein [Roseivivax halodurans]ETX16682.1 universal stress protein UspA [Roseivivax halodurans JCM 10272]
MLTNILVPVRGDGMVGTVLGHAAALARHHKAHVMVVHCRPPPRDLIPHTTMLPGFARQTFLSQAEELADRQEDHLRRSLHVLAAEYGLEEGDPRPGQAATCEFIEEPGKMADVVKHNGRLADLIVVAKPQRERNLGETTLKSAIFGSGRPVMVCPGQVQPDAGFGRHVAIGWNGSLPASRAVAMTLDLVSAAETVTILTGNKGQPHGASTEELVKYYALRGVEAAIVPFESRSPAKALLRLAKECGASLLITGAYSHSQGSDMLFGGNTQVLVDELTQPVVMAH